MFDLIISILSAATVSTLLTGALLWLTKSWISERLKNAIKHEYDEKLESHKAQLKAESDTTLERLKSQLQVAAAERQVRYSRVFERTAETAATTYQKLLAFHDAVGRYTSAFEWADTPPKEERRKIVGERYQEFLDYFRPRRLYLPKETSRRLNDLHNKLHSAAVDFMFNVEQGGDERRRRKDPDRDTWIEVDKFMREEVPKLLELLEDHFRELLGI